MSGNIGENKSFDDVRQEILNAIHECAVEVAQSDGDAAVKYAQAALDMARTYDILSVHA